MKIQVNARNRTHLFETEAGAGEKILHAGLMRGIALPYECASGTCGTCKTRLLEGEADHRDMVLMDEEKADKIMICVSRACSGGRLVLDL